MQLWLHTLGAGGPRDFEVRLHALAVNHCRSIGPADRGGDAQPGVQAVAHRVPAEGDAGGLEAGAEQAHGVKGDEQVYRDAVVLLMPDRAQAELRLEAYLKAMKKRTK